MTVPEPRPERRRAPALIAWSVVAAFGIALATLPHLVRWWSTGDPTFFADGDGLLYHTWLREALFRGHPWMVDGVHDGRPPMMHPSLLLVPPALIAHALGGTPFLLGLVIRTMAGAGLALGLLFALRSRVRPAGLAVGLTLWLLFDPGFLFGQVALRPIQIAYDLARGERSIFNLVPMFLPHLRVVTPSFPTVLLLIHLGAVLRARSGEPGKGTRAWIGVAAASLAFLIHAYFYIWTMLVLGAAAAIVLDARGRNVYLPVLLIGLALGSPFLLENARIRAATSPDWLLRTAKFVPIPRLSELLIPRVLIGQWALAGAWVWSRRRDLAYPWCAVGAGLVLLNHQVVTGLQIENDHWTVAYGPAFSLLLALIVAPGLGGLLEGRPGRARALAGLLAAHLALGFGYRSAECTLTRETAAVNREASLWRAARWPIPDGAVVAGDPDLLFVGAAHATFRPLFCRLVEFSSAADDRELDERLVLNLYLRGTSRDRARAIVSQPPGTLSWEAYAARTPSVAERQRDRRLALVDSTWDDPAPAIRKYGVAYLLLREDLGEKPPGAVGVSAGQSVGGTTLYRIR